jgi:hypothetical protein
MSLAPVTDDDWADALRHRITGVVALPEDPDYQRIMPWPCPSRRVPRSSPPRRTISPRLSASPPRAASRWRCRPPGHGALPIGPDSILVHTGGLTGCAVDPLNRTAWVGAGATWQHLLDAVTPLGLAPACGSAPGVGVVGFLTGGGIGLLVRSIGLSSDHVRAFELVTGSGEVLRVTPDQHSDLFWRLRGSKPTLGIVTAVEIELLSITEFYGAAIYFDGADAGAVLSAWQSWCAGFRKTSTPRSPCCSFPSARGSAATGRPVHRHGPVRGAR